MTIIKNFWSLTYLIILPLFCLSENELIIDEKQEIYVIGSFSVLPDSMNIITIENISTLEKNSKFIDIKQLPDVGKILSHTYWIKFKITNNLKEPFECFLKIPWVNYADLYIPNKSGGYIIKKTGFSLPFYDKDFILSNRNDIGLYLQAQETNEYFLRLEDSEYLNPEFNIKIFSKLKILEFYRVDRFVLGLLYGIILLMIFYNLFLFLSIRDNTYLYYVFYLVSFELFWMTETKYAFEFIWPNNPEWNEPLSGFFTLLIVFWYIIFSKSYLNLKRQLPAWNKSINVMLSIGIIFIMLFTLKIIPLKQIIDNSIFQVCALVLCFSFIIIPAVVCVRKRHRPAIFFLIANFCLLISILLMGLYFSGVIPSNVITRNIIPVGASAEFIVFSLGLVDRLKILRKEKENAMKNAMKMLEQKVQERTVQVVKQKDEVERQKLSVEHKNKEIVASITYAERIQSAILPPLSLVRQHLLDCFVLYKAKDIVAGDFYWLETVGDDIYFSAADCTGHGVPGAMMSVMCSNALTKSVKELGLSKPGEILDATTKIIEGRFERSEQMVLDGMDLALCSLNLETKMLCYSGANNPLWVVRNNVSEIEEFKADKQPIGIVDDRYPYSKHNVQLASGDTIYIFSDGYVDQFGGPKGKKFKSKSFKKLLLSVQDREMDEQKTLLLDAFENWKGNLEQVDDVCIIGVKI